MADMSDHVQRYELSLLDGPDYEMWPRNSGDWVRYSDHEQVADLLTALLGMLEYSTPTHRNDCPHSPCTCGLDQAKARLEALTKAKP